MNFFTWSHPLPACSLTRKACVIVIPTNALITRVGQDRLECSMRFHDGDQFRSCTIALVDGALVRMCMATFNALMQHKAQAQ